MDLLNGYGAISSQIDTLWNIFMLVHLTLFAGLWKLDKHKTIGTVEWSGLLAGYIVFAYLNWNALRGDYNILGHIARDIGGYAGDDLRRYSNTIRAVTRQAPTSRGFVVAFVHIFAGLFIIIYGAYLSLDKKLPLTWRSIRSLFTRSGRSWEKL